MTEETTPPIEVNEEPTNAPTIPEPIEKLKKHLSKTKVLSENSDAISTKPSKKRVRETPPPKIKKVYNDRYKMGLLAEKLVEKIKPELKPDVKQEVKAEPLPEQMKITIKESPIQCPKDDEDIKQFPTGKIFDKYDDTRLLNKYKKMKQRFNALSEEVSQIKAHNKPKINQAIYNHLFSNR